MKMNHLRKLVTNTASKVPRKLFRLPVFKNTLRCLGSIETPTESRTTQKSIPKGILGQPTCHTHPHLIMEEHLTHGITQAEYKERREQFVSRLVREVENMHNTHIIVIPAASKQFMSDKIPYVFRQNSDFFYLTGCLEPSAVLVLMKPSQTDEFKSILFVHDKDAHAELWEGPRTGCAAAARLFAVDESRPVDTFATFLNKMTVSSKPALLWYHKESPPNPDIHNIVRGTLRGDHSLAIMDPQRALHFMRVVKSPAEIELMKETCYIGSQSINMAMACTKPGISEHIVNAVLEYTCKQGGAEHLSFPPVVAGGARATHIHYVANNQLLGSDEMLLVDSVSSKPALLWYHKESPPNPDIHNIVRGTLRGDHSLAIMDPQRALHFMRVVKSPAEIELMKETCYIGSQSINMAMACTKPGISEHIVNAVLEYTCKQGGAEHLSFPPVVAGGARATHIHYVANNQLLGSDEMLLVDSGSQRWMYNSDISRTWPVSGKFSRHHRILYELVLNVQTRLIEILGEQRPPLDTLFDSMCRLLGTHLQQEGIISKNITGSELLGKAYSLCPHHVSHYLGIDVHDAPLVRRNVPVNTNMIVTVEPGIYIRPDDTTIPEEFRGIGIRIEDDVLVTDSDPIVLTDTCIKEVDDIEAIVGKHGL